MRYKPVLITFCLAATLQISACGGGGSKSSDDNSDGETTVAPPTAPTTPTANALAVITPIAAGATCPAGGVDVAFGLDDNDNGILDTGEIDGAQVHCTDPTGSATALALVTTLEPGVSCPTGGVQVDSGLDDNSNGQLDADEIDDTQAVCNDVVDDEPLPANLVINSEEPAGANCEFGGVRIDAGLDTNENGVLDPDEITATEFVCEAGPDTFSGLVYIADALDDEVNAVFRTAPDAEQSALLALPRANPGGAVSFRLSPDRSKAAILGDLERTGTHELYIADTLSGQLAIKASGSMVGGGDVLGDYQWSPDGSQLAYRADQDANGVIELFVVDVDGGNNRKLSGILPKRADVDEFQWSFDGTRIAYRADQNTRDVSELFTVRSDGSDNIRVSGDLVYNGDVKAAFSWSPTIDRLVYRADQEADNVFELFAVNGDGSNAIKLNPTPVRRGDVIADSFHWSPDGNQIAYRAELDIDRVIEVYVVDQDGANHQQVSEEMITGGDATGPVAWSADGTRLAYIADQAVNGVQELFTVLSDGSVNTRVSDAAALGGNVRDFAWSPAANTLAYVANQNDLAIDELFVVSTDGSGNTLLSVSTIAGGNVMDFAWSPDGNHTAYLAADASAVFSELFTATSDGSASRKVSGELPAGGTVHTYTWSPDSARVAYAAMQDSSVATELFTNATDGSDNIKVSRALVDGGNVAAFGW